MFQVQDMDKKNCGNSSLLEVPTSSLHSKYFLCSDHFNDDQYYNDQRVKLLPNAVPTEFLNDCLSESDMEIYPVMGRFDIIASKYWFKYLGY